MQKVIDFINTHTYDIFIPLTALALLRLAMCWAQLKQTAAIRKKKGVYHAVREHYAEMGAWLGILPFCVLALILPRIWYVWIALAVIGGVLVGRAGKKKGVELKHEAEAEAAREAASHTLEGGAAAIEDGHAGETEHNEDKGETENG